MSGARYTDEFKADAVKQVTERGYGVVEVAKRFGISDKSLYVWVKKSQQSSGSAAKIEVLALKNEINRMKAVELVTLEWMAWFSHQRLLESIGYIPPAEAEAQYYRQFTTTTDAV